jgi:hypothetical protein
MRVSASRAKLTAPVLEFVAGRVKYPANANPLANSEFPGAAAQFGNVPDDLVPRHDRQDRWWRPPFNLIELSVAYAAGGDPDQYFIGSRDRQRKVDHLQWSWLHLKWGNLVDHHCTHIETLAIC